MNRPEPSEVWKAIEIYLRLAYGGSPPSAIRMRLETLRAMPAEEFYNCTVLERDAAHPPVRYSLRLGNPIYPHMKLTLERRPDQQGFLFKADTHDRHCCPPPDSREYPAFTDLMAKNQKLAQAVEAAWAEAGLPTFKTYLREDLAKRAEKQRTE